LEPSQNPHSLDPAVTQGLAEAGGDREDVRPGLFLALEAVRLQNSSCEPCPTSWLPFGSSCYYFSVRKTTWAEVQGHCADARGGDFLSHHTSALEYWIGRKAVQHLCGPGMEDGGPESILSLDSQQHPPFNCCNHWLQGEHSECWGCEACVMILGMGLWMDPPCDEKAGRICEKRHGAEPARCSRAMPSAQRGAMHHPGSWNPLAMIFFSPSTTARTNRPGPALSSACTLGPLGLTPSLLLAKVRQLRNGAIWFSCTFLQRGEWYFLQSSLCSLGEHQ
uniref:C-type lectin domain-containing protein n=1 Tax=Piliocolobus tephrosceles TaxID=591936 RepID=A0A8C9I3G2_9PRIM